MCYCAQFWNGLAKLDVSFVSPLALVRVTCAELAEICFFRPNPKLKWEKDSQALFGVHYLSNVHLTPVNVV